MKEETKRILKITFLAIYVIFLIIISFISKYENITEAIGIAMFFLIIMGIIFIDSYKTKDKVSEPIFNENFLPSPPPQPFVLSKYHLKMIQIFSVSFLILYVIAIILLRLKFDFNIFLSLLLIVIISSSYFLIERNITKENNVKKLNLSYIIFTLLLIIIFNINMSILLKFILFIISTFIFIIALILIYKKDSN